MAARGDNQDEALAAMMDAAPGCLSCLMGSDGDMDACMSEEAGAEMAAAAATACANDADSAVANTLINTKLGGGEIADDWVTGLTEACLRTVMSGSGLPAPIQCFQTCPGGSPPLRSCAAFTEGFGEGGCAATCIGAISSANMEVATDLACPAAVAVVPASLPITVSDEQQAALADTDSDEFADFANDFASGVAATMDTVASEQVTVLSVGARRRQLSDRRRMPTLSVGKHTSDNDGHSRTSSSAHSGFLAVPMHSTPRSEWLMRLTPAAVDYCRFHRHLPGC